MTAAAPIPWSPRSWIATVLLLWAAMAGILWLLTAREITPPAPDRPFHAAIAGPAHGEAITSPDLFDPTLFALPHPRGFSGAAWLRVPERDHAFRERTTDNHWLEFRPESLGLTFIETVRAAQPPHRTAALKPDPAADAPIPPAETSLPALSQLRLTGPLATRPFLAPPPLPDWPHTELLRPTEITLAVDAHGDVFSAAVTAESGLKTADTRAIEIARALRFQEARGASLQFGVLHFEWAVRAPVAAP